MNRCRYVPWWGLSVWASSLFVCVAGICRAADPPEAIPKQITNSIGMKLALIPAGKAAGPHANEANPGQPKTGRCRFRVVGLYHEAMGRVNEELARRHPSLGGIAFTDYGFCDECWNKIEAAEAFRRVSRHLDGGRTGDYDPHPDRYHPRRVPWDVSTDRDFPLDTDLAPLAKAVLTVRTRHRWARAFYVLLYVAPKVNQAKAIHRVLAGLPGVDARTSAVDVKAGRIHVRISGQKPIRMTDLVGSLEKAGIEVTTSRGR